LKSLWILRIMLLNERPDFAKIKFQKFKMDVVFFFKVSKSALIYT
jgi:hypothetical protein